jgi:hypothetical protein
MTIPGVVGTAEGLTETGRPCVLVLVAERTPEVRAIPRALDGHPVVIQVTGEIRPFDEL